MVIAAFRQFYSFKDNIEEIVNVKGLNMQDESLKAYELIRPLSKNLETRPIGEKEKEMFNTKALNVNLLGQNMNIIPVKTHDDKEGFLKLFKFVDNNELFVMTDFYEENKKYEMKNLKRIIPSEKHVENLYSRDIKENLLEEIKIAKEIDTSNQKDMNNKHQLK